MGFASLTAALEKQTSKASCIKAGWEVHPDGENLLLPQQQKPVGLLVSESLLCYSHIPTTGTDAQSPVEFAE